MKRYLFMPLLCLTAFSVQAQMVPEVSESDNRYNYSYSQDRIDQGYSAPVVYQRGGAYAGSNGPMVAAPASPQAYEFYQQPVEVGYNANAPRVPMTWYPTQQQRALASGQVYADPAYGDEEQMDVYQSPVYNSKAVRQKHSWYADFHLGVGGTIGWKNDFDTPIVPIWGIAVGIKLSPTLRADAEFAYHTKAKLMKNSAGEIRYKQYDLGLNVYYDFPVQSSVKFRPFLGAGLWAIDGKTTATRHGVRMSSADSDLKVGLSGAAGIAYPINNVLSLIAMARARYVSTDDDLWNLEGLFGVRYQF